MLILALGINTFLVINAPDPPPSGYTLEEAAIALKTGKVELQNGRTLTTTTATTTPSFVSQPARGPFGMMSAALEQKAGGAAGRPG
ncbi:hypothetical protein ABI_26430 [Asticcacaulis biprosthecium C19]|uniref:Uncharacterized protein n=1 Tax=Asticcacaulis biprosthecium C19 TaxID=715226 RepID=F4QPH0_9CAUL|nr:hypothetical protein ABI_26430 [Asticcacaulis biprosthecium C19]